MTLPCNDTRAVSDITNILRGTLPNALESLVYIGRCLHLRLAASRDVASRFELDEFIRSTTLCMHTILFYVMNEHQILLAATRRSRSLPPWDINESFPLTFGIRCLHTHTNDSYLELYDTLLERDSAAKSTMVTFLALSLGHGLARASATRRLATTDVVEEHV